MKRADKKIYFDCETTGVNPEKNAIIQMAGMITLNDKEVDKFNFNIKPFGSDVIEQRALDVNKITIDELKKFSNPKDAYGDIVKMFDTHIDKYDRKDKFVVCGYNVKFDIDFLNSFFKKNKDDYLFSYFGCVQDPYPILSYLKAIGKIDIDKLNLESACAFYNIKMKNAHDAMCDIEATKLLIKKISERLEIVNWGGL